MRCPHCGATLGSDATWCGLCHAQFARQAAPAAPSPYGIPAYAGVPAAPPPGYPPNAAVPGYPPGYAPPGQLPQPQARLQPPPAQRLPAEQPRRGAGWTTFAAIAVGALIQYAFSQLTKSDSIENEALIRYAIVSTLAVYGVVTWLVIGRLASDDHPLRWRGSWPIAPSAALGLAIGGGLAFRLLELARGAGDERGDAVASLLVSEGDVPHIAVAVLLLVVAAPVVEELLFRGVLLAAFERHGKGVALLVSSLAFAAWHLEPWLLLYYTVAGVILGGLYLRKGLACSIGAHAAFNGMLLLASISYATAPGDVLQRDALTLRAPKGWHAVAGAPYATLTGPSAANVSVVAVRGAFREADPAEIVARVQTGTMPQIEGFGPRRDTARTVDLPAGEAVRVRIEVDGRDGDLVLLPDGNDVYLITLSSGGSQRVRADFDAMLEGLVLR